jgi:hypothetical protein
VHTVIAGISQSGKSYLSRTVICPTLARLGRKVLVCDPTIEREGGPNPVGHSRHGPIAWNGARWGTPDCHRLMGAMQANTYRDSHGVPHGCAVIVEEVAETICQNEAMARELTYIVTRSANDGHDVFLVAQYMFQISKRYRSCISKGYLFHQPPEAAAVCSEVFGKAWMRDKLPELPKGVCYYVEPFAEPVLMTVL